MISSATYTTPGLHTAMNFIRTPAGSEKSSIKSVIFWQIVQFEAQEEHVLFEKYMPAAANFRSAKGKRRG